MPPEVRQDFVSAAADSMESLQRVLQQLTEEEVDVALEREYQGQRRASIMDRLISRKVRLVEIRVRQSLKQRYLR